MSETTASPSIVVTAVGAIGVVLYLGVGFIYLTSGLVVPFPWLAVLWVVWVLGIYPLVKVFQARRIWTPAVPVSAIVLWWLYLSIGEAFLGWAP